jgi:hypothetical protein
MVVKTKKEEVAYLLGKVIEQYEQSTGQRIVRNTNRKNYEDLARTLSEISNQLPYTAQQLDHDYYSPDPNVKKLDFPHRKYDITGGQIKDAYHQIVANPRNFLVDACYIYLYGVGRKGFEKNHPNGSDLIKSEQGVSQEQLSSTDWSPAEPITTRPPKKRNTALWIGLGIALAGWAYTMSTLYRVQTEWNQLKTDMSILPYQPTQAEIDSLEGIWLYYTGAPQARGNDPHRYHQVANNLVEISYKDGYFTVNRYGANIDHTGYAQFEAPSVVSLHSHVKNSTRKVESPIHALLRLDKEKGHLSSIAASWNFDTGQGNDIIGSRNVFIKQGKGGTLEEITNTTENASCHCRILKWNQPARKTTFFQLKYRLLDTLADKSLKKLIDEKSILLREPQEVLILSSN